MAQRTIVQLVSDLSGEEMDDGEGRTLGFSYDGVEYTIDLTAEETEQFDEVMTDYINAATPVGGRRASAGRTRRSSTSRGRSAPSRRSSRR